MRLSSCSARPNAVPGLDQGLFALIEERERSGDMKFGS
jgi:hypothetical protein